MSRYLIISFVLFAVACELEEIPVRERQPGSLEEVVITMGVDYGSQIFYNLADNEIVSQNEKLAWDLGFECSDTGWHVILNTARGGAAGYVSGLTFNSEVNLNDLEWAWDAHSGELDSTALTDYADKVFVVDRGYEPSGAHTGYYRLSIDTISNSTYQITVSDLDGSNKTTKIIEKDVSRNFVCYSFETGVVEIQPERDKWDLLFTQYTQIFIDPPVSYLVTGVLTNRTRLSVAIVNNQSLDRITREDAKELDFDSRIDAIGYDWKEYDFDLDLYVIDSDRLYVIRDEIGRYFALRFIDFHDENGDRGTPTFEVREL